MWRLSVRLFIAIAIEFVIDLFFFVFISWLLGASPLWILAYSVFMTVILLFLSWLIAPSMVLSCISPRWIERSDDPVLWSMVNEEATKAGVKVRRIGIVDYEVANALTYAFLTGRPHLIFSKGLLVKMTFPEVRAVTNYLLGSVKSGGLSLLTTFSGIMTLPYKMSRSYIDARLEKRRLGYSSLLSAGLGYILFALTYPQSIMVSKIMSIFSDEFCMLKTNDPSKLLSALIKVSVDSALIPTNQFRTECTPLKCLMFQDPSLAIRDARIMQEVVGERGIDLERLIDLEKVSFPDEDEIGLHAFERFWSHPNLVNRFDHAVDFGKKIQTPIKIGLSWIE